MKKTLITKDQFKVMSWKNGAGTTAEIAIDPANSDFRKNDFNWRLSSARIQDENQFSAFPGYDRVLTVLSGDGLLLGDQELGPFEVFEFRGEDLIECSLVGSPVEDLGVIFKRDEYQCFMKILDVSAPMYQKLEAGVHFFLSIGGSVTVDGTSFSQAAFLKVENENSVGVEISALKYPVYLLLIEIKDRSGMKA